MAQLNSFGAEATLRSGSADYRIFRLDADDTYVGSQRLGRGPDTRKGQRRRGRIASAAALFQLGHPWTNAASAS